MTDWSADPETPDTGMAPHRAPDTGTPRWVKVSLIIALVVVLLLVLAKVTGAGGEHGPGRHGGENGSPSTVVDMESEHRSLVDHQP